MARIDRARFDAGRFPITVEIPTRFDDLDVQGHVNNAATVVLLQEARVAFNRAAGLVDRMGGLRAMVAGLTVEYAGELRFPAPVSIAIGTVAIGRTSFTIGHRVDQEGVPRIYAEAVMVLADDTGPTPIPDALRDAYRRLSID